MAVFTEVSRTELDTWLTRYAPLGPISEFRGIPSGIENSNFFVSAAAGRWVLTLFERLAPAQLPFYLELMRHLAARGVPCPAPLPDRSGALFSELKGKPAALVARLPGRGLTHPEAVHCAQIGAALARMHLAGHDFPLVQPNLRGLAWWRDVVPGLYGFLDAAQAELLADEMRTQEAQLPAIVASIPAGPIHADLFRDNALFEGDALGGVIDFYFAGCDTWLFDVAVCLNDWCIDLPTGRLDDARVTALLSLLPAGERHIIPLVVQRTADRVPRATRQPMLDGMVEARLQALAKAVRRGRPGALAADSDLMGPAFAQQRAEAVAAAVAAEEEVKGRAQSKVIYRNIMAQEIRAVHCQADCGASADGARPSSAKRRVVEVGGRFLRGPSPGAAADLLCADEAADEASRGSALSDSACAFYLAALQARAEAQRLLFVCRAYSAYGAAAAEPAAPLPEGDGRAEEDGGRPAADDARSAEDGGSAATCLTDVLTYNG